MSNETTIEEERIVAKFWAFTTLSPEARQRIEEAAQIDDADEHLFKLCGDCPRDPDWIYNSERAEAAELGLTIEEWREIQGSRIGQIAMHDSFMLGIIFYRYGHLSLDDFIQQYSEAMTAGTMTQINLENRKAWEEWEKQDEAESSAR